MNYKTTCPNCGKSNLWVTESNGKRFCFNCSYFERNNNSEVVLVRSPNLLSIRELYTEIAQYYHSCLDTPQLKYLEERGIAEQTVKDLLIGYCPQKNHVLYIGELAKDAGIGYDGNPFLGNRIIFPYWYDGMITDMRGRLFSGEGDTYKSPFHSAYYRGADYSYNDKLSITEEVIITEGEIKPIVPSQNGLDVRALPGIRSNRLITLHPKQKSIICFDNQRNNRRELLNAIKQLANKLQNVYVATLPLFGEIKQDIDGFILKYGFDAFMKVIKAALPFDTWKNYATI